VSARDGDRPGGGDRAGAADRRWRLLAASIPGTSHEASGTPCQDAHCPDGPFELDERLLVAAVADGAGSAEHAQAASALVVRSAVEALRRRAVTLRGAGLPGADDAAWRALLIDAVEDVRAELAGEVQRQGADPRQFATTLVLLLATPDVTAVVQIGDGACVVGDQGGAIVGLTMPQNAGYLNASTFVLSDEAIETAQVAVWRGEVTHIAMLTDGLDLLALNMPEATPHEPFFAPLFRFMSEANGESEARKEFLSFLTSERVRERTSDDVTLLLAAKTHVAGM
jgi:hypothetical protein